MIHKQQQRQDRAVTTSHRHRRKPQEKEPEQGQPKKRTHPIISSGSSRAPVFRPSTAHIGGNLHSLSVTAFPPRPAFSAVHKGLHTRSLDARELPAGGFFLLSQPAPATLLLQP